jgi:choline dehydrogenase-like flavoprotein
MNYDYIIIGSGAGGAAAAWRLASAGSQVLLLEKGDALPRDGSTLDVERVIRAGSFKSHEPWLDGNGRRFAPEEYFNLGGKTKWYGAALLRYSPREFEPDDGHQCKGWPIGYTDLEPYYAEAEQRLGVRVFAPEPDLAAIVRRLTRNGSNWQAEALPLALAMEITEHPEEAAHFDAFASVKGLKGDAECAFLQAAGELPNLQVHSGSAVVELLGDDNRMERLRGVMTGDGKIFEGRRVLLAAGALHSPRLLQQYLRRTGLETRLPCATQVGRYYKQHLLTALVAFTPRRQRDLLRKTLVLLNERVPHSSVQPLGFDGELIGALMPALVPRRLATALGQYAYGFFLQTEDGSDAANRINADYGGGLPQMDYDPHRLAPALNEHRRLVNSFRNALLRAGCLGFSKRIPLSGTAHACGSLVAGDDPASSVVDAAGRVHGMDNLYVVDGSVLPRSSRVNPSLTIYAWSLRVSDLLTRHATEVHDADDRKPVTA